MKNPHYPATSSISPLSNAEIADRLLSLAQLLAGRKENPFKIKAYRRAARTIKDVGESIDELVRHGVNLEEYPNIGKAIAGAIREIVETGTLRQIQTLRAQMTPETAAISEFPLLDPKRVLRIFKKLKISTVAELTDKLNGGEIAAVLGPRMDQHVRQALTNSPEMLWYHAQNVVAAVQKFLLAHCGVSRAEAAGDFRRRVEVVRDVAFLVETDNFSKVLEKLRSYGGKAEIVEARDDRARIRLSSGIVLAVNAVPNSKWGVGLIAATGSERHLRKLQLQGGGLDQLLCSSDDYSSEAALYTRMGLGFIPPELREGTTEITLAAQNRLPLLVSCADIRGELHAHSTSSDGSNTIEEMAAAAQAHGYEYIGISDHSQSLKIAGGLSEAALWDQIRLIDKLNESLNGIRVLKSAEVDILLDGTLDYPDELLKELDYTICSIHSRFGLGKTAQTERIMRAMDNRYFSILGHATGRLLLKRPGYELEIDRIVEHARQRVCYFEINSSPDRLDLSAEHARLAGEAGVKVAVTTDAHSTHDFSYLRYGIDQARRAALERESVLNHRRWPDLQQLLKK